MLCKRISARTEQILRLRRPIHQLHLASLISLLRVCQHQVELLPLRLYCLDLRLRHAVERYVWSW